MNQPPDQPNEWNERNSKRLERGIYIVFLGLPCLTMFINGELGAFLLILGMFCTAGFFTLRSRMRSRQIYQASKDPTPAFSAQPRDSVSRIIVVELFDDAGQPLDSAIAQQRIAEAYASATPRDTVMLVHERRR